MSLTVDESIDFELFTDRELKTRLLRAKLNLKQVQSYVEEVEAELIARQHG